MARKNAAAVAMAHKRWAKTTKAERKAYAKKIVGVRWAKVRERAVADAIEETFRALEDTEAKARG